MDAKTLHRFWDKMCPEPNTGCWLWTAGISRTTGYTRFWHEGDTRSAHRVAYEHFVGPIPPGLHIDHLCRVRCCVNPDHMEAVTPFENNRRSASLTARNARKTHCLRGHAFDATNTYRRPDGYRDCRACMVHRHTARSARSPS